MTNDKPQSPSKKSRGLGRGLDALLGDRPSRVEPAPSTNNRSPIMPGQITATSEKQSEIAPDNIVPIEHIIANPLQPRKAFSKEGLSELADSIKSTGLLQPILVRPLMQASTQGAKYEIVAGERRWRASQLAGLHEVPVVVRELDDQQTAEIGLIENIQRVDLNPMEEAEAYHHLSKTYARSQEEIAKSVGKSRSHVANMMRLTGLPKSARGALLEGHISMGHARALLGSSEIALHLAETLTKGFSVRQLEALIKRDNEKGLGKPKLQKPSSKSDNKDADTRGLERDLAEALGLEVAINHRSGGKGDISISYLDLDQLDDVCRRLMESTV